MPPPNSRIGAGATTVVTRFHSVLVIVIHEGAQHSHRPYQNIVQERWVVYPSKVHL